VFGLCTTFALADSIPFTIPSANIKCPSDENLSFIALARDEAYRFTIDGKGGLDIEFWTWRNSE
jgi:hypothetical protein